MRKFICVILSILILGSSVITEDFFNIFTFAESNVISSDSTNIYPQNLYIAEQYSENFDNIFVGTDSSSYARTYYNSMLNDDSFITGIVAWETIHIATSPSYSLESGMVTKTDFYRTALFDYLTVQIESGSTGEYFENIYKQVKNEYTSFIVSSTKTIMGKEKNISANELKTLKLTEDRKQLLLNGTWLGQTASTISDVMKILEWAKNFYDAVELVAKYCALTDLHDGTKEILSYIANDTSNHLDLRIAAQDCAECMGDSYQEVLEAMLNGSYSAFFDVLGDYMDLGWNKLMTKIPGANIVFLGAKGIRAIANLFDSKDEKVKAYYQIEASVKCEDAILKAMSAYRSKFDSNSTQENAVLYLKAAEMYKSVVLLGYDYSVDLLNIVNNSTSALIFNQTEDCTALINDIKTFKLNKQSYYERFDTATLNAYKETYFPDYDQLEASANTSYVCPFSYTVNNGTVTITKYNGSATTVRIPELINNYPVTSIGAGAFEKCKSIESVVLPNIVNSIGNYAFYDCERLNSITIPDSVTNIGSEAFLCCDSLTSIVIPDSITSISERTFYSCDSLTSIIIPDSVTSIGNSAFSGCSKLTNITIPDSVTSIGNSAFSGCSKLTSITIPEGVTKIGNYTFSDCMRLASINLPDGVTYIGESAFFGTKLTSITIPDCVNTIGKEAFAWCNYLTEITIPNSVTYIGEYAFDECYNLTNVYISDIENWYKITFDNYYSNPMCYAKNIYLNGNLITSVTIPETIKKINSFAFMNFSFLTGITIPESVTNIGNSSFSGCDSLTNIIIPDSVMGIGNSAFSGCGNLTSIIIPDSVTSIGNSAFSGCSNLTSIIIPDSVTSIGASAFSFCSSLTEITIPNSVKYIGDGAFFACGNLKSVIIPNSVTSIGEETFYRCYNLIDITLPDSITSIGSKAFYECTNITSIIVPRSVTNIENYTFSNCSSLTTVILPKGITKIGNSVFSYCSSLTSITIPDSVTSIGDFAFYDCTNLTKIIIPESVTLMNEYTLASCDNLTVFCSYNSYADAFAQTNGINRIIFGDYNQDYIVNAVDLSVMRKYLMASIESEQPDMVISDYNRDNEFDIRDLVRLKKQLAA